MNSFLTEDRTVRALVDATGCQVPKGRITVREFAPVTPHSYWSGGTKDMWYLADIATGQVSVPARDSGLFAVSTPEITSLPEGLALIEVTIGNFRAATVYVRPENLTPLLPKAEVELTPDEWVVLVCTSSLKSAYRRENAAKVWGSYIVTDKVKARWDAAVAGLRDKGMVDSRGAATIEGHNRRGKADVWSLRQTA